MNQSIDQAIENEMGIFEELKKQYPSLKEFKDVIFQQFKNHFQAIINYVIELYDGEIYASNWVINGAILRSLNFYRGAIWALGTRNSHVFYDSLRSQCETLALLHYCVSKPDYVTAAGLGNRETKDKSMKIVNILKMIDKLDKKYTGIRKDYDDLCNFVHPNPKSMVVNIEPLESNNSGFIVRIGTRCTRIDDVTAKKYLEILLTWTDWVFRELSDLAKFKIDDFSNNKSVAKIQ